MPLHKRKELFLEQAIALAEKEASPIIGRSDIITHTKALVLAQMRSPLLQDNSLPLDAAMQHLAALVSKSIQGITANIEVEGPEKTFNQALIRQLRGIDCQLCATPFQTVCCGGSGDDAIVNNGGHCYSLIWFMFNTSVNISVFYYNKYGPAVSEVPPGPVFTLSTVSVSSFDVVCKEIGASFITRTRFLDAEKEHRSEIIIEFVSNGVLFDIEQYNLLFASLFVECFCHAYAGIEGAASGEGRDYKDALAEGWMTWVAWKILEEVASGNSGGELADWPSELDIALLSAGFHRQIFRRNDRGASGNRNREVRIGSEVAATTCFAMERYGRFDTGAWAAFLRLSCAFNVVPLGPREQRQFIEFFSRSFAEEPLAPPFIRALQILRDFDHEGDISRLLERISVGTDRQFE
jgi:hypothetical protein